MDEKILNYLSDVVTLSQFSNAAQIRLANFNEMQPYFEKLDGSLNAFWNLGTSESVDLYALSNYAQHLENLVSIVMGKYGVEGNAYKNILESSEVYLSAFYKSVVSRVALATYNTSLVAPSKAVLVEFEKLTRELPTVFKGAATQSAISAFKLYFETGSISSGVTSGVVNALKVADASGLNASLNVQFKAGVCSLTLSSAGNSDLKTEVNVSAAGSTREVEAEIAKLVGDLASGWVKLNSKVLSAEIDAYVAKKEEEKARINSFAQELAKLTPEQAQALAQAVMQNANWNMIIKSKE